MNKTTSLVTGGAGFIGSHLVDYLIDNGEDVIVIDDLSGGHRNNVNVDCVFYHGSICDVDLLAEIFDKHNIDYVYHLAAYAAEGLSHFIRRFNYQNNLIGSINLINCSVKHKIKCFVFTSSIAVYGAGELPLKESQYPIPEDPYGIAKHAVEQDLKCALDMFGLNYIVFRPHNVYGERQNIADKYRNVIGIFMNMLLNNKEIPIFGDGKQTRAFTYVHDICDIMSKSATITSMYNQCYNLGSDKFYSILELAKVVQKTLSINSDINHLEERQEVKHAYCSHEKIKKYYPHPINETDLYTGVKNMSEWAMKENIEPTKKFEAIEIQEKLPPFWAS